MTNAARVAGLLLTMACGLAQAEWIQFFSSIDGKVYTYDPARVVSLPDGKIKVWYQVTQSAQSKIAEIESMARQSESMGVGGKETAMLFREKIPSYKEYSHTMHRTIFDCRRQKHLGEEFIDYSKNGEELDRLNTGALIAELETKGHRVNSERFAEIFPGSYIEMLMIKVCR